MSRFPTAGASVQLGRHVSRPERECGQAAQRQDAQRATGICAATLIQAGLGAIHSKGTALQARYHRVKRHRGHKKAVVAVGHQILEIAYYVMRDGVTYDELGADYFDRRHAERAVRRHVRQLEALGFHVTIEKAA